MSGNPRCQSVNLCDDINRELRSALEWTSANKITVNPKKSLALVMPPKITNLIPTMEIILNNNPVSVKKSEKYLGIAVDKKINLTEHITKYLNLSTLSKLRNFLLFAALSKLYYIMVHCHLLYGIVIRGNTYANSHLKRLISLQNKAVKIVAGEQRLDHVILFYHGLQILKLKNMYVNEVAKLTYKNSWKKLPNRLNCQFSSVRAIHTRTTRLTLSELIICIYQDTEHKCYKKVFSIKKPKFGTRYHTNF